MFWTVYKTHRMVRLGKVRFSTCFQVETLKLIEKTHRMPPGVYFNVDKEAFNDFFRRVFSTCFFDVFWTAQKLIEWLG